MPPDDPIFDSQPGAEGPSQDPNPSPSSQNAREGGSASETPPGAMTAEQVADIVRQQVAPMQETLQGMGQFFQQLQEQTQDRLQDGGGGGEAQGDDFTERFYQNPQEAVVQEFGRQAAPLISQQAEVLSAMLIEGEKTKIDGRFGEGTWDEVFQPELGPVIDQVKKTDPMRLMNRAAIENAVATVIGKNMDSLVEKRQGRESALQDSQGDLVSRVTERVLSQTNMTGGLRRVEGGGKPKLSDDQQEMLSLFERDTGERRDPERMAAIMQSGNTLEEWQAAQKKLNGGASGGAGE